MLRDASDVYGRRQKQGSQGGPNNPTDCDLPGRGDSEISVPFVASQKADFEKHAFCAHFSEKQRKRNIAGTMLRLNL